MTRIKDFFLGDEGWLVEPTRFRKLNGYATLVWALMLPVSYFMGWVEVVVFISVISIYANFGAHLSTWAASRAEEMVRDDDSVQSAEIKELKKQVKEIHDLLVKQNDGE
jgi:hypothetical protein